MGTKRVEDKKAGKGPSVRSSFTNSKKHAQQPGFCKAPQQDMSDLSGSPEITRYIKKQQQKR
ncbi:hypothetical protein ABBQ38_013591 [Trebouxia sp. C0009 RCD-2024]